jgi:S1-C subfamily serine protease
MRPLRQDSRLLIVLLLISFIVGISCINVESYQEEPSYSTSVPSGMTSSSSEGISADYLPTVLAKIQGTPISAEEIPVKAVVQIVVRGTINGVIQEWSGSGTIISPDGFILTNAHVAMGDRSYPAEELLIKLTVAEDQSPEASFYAEVVQADENLDIAVLRPSTDLKGNAIDRSSLNLPYVSLGDSDSLHLGDDIVILGYPGIGGDTVTLTSGEVSGFTSEEGYGNRAFIKTSATIAGGNSGGLAIDSTNHLVGIPTQVGAGEETGDIVDCRPLADTNRDGYVDEYDTCVPTGGFINALRPVKLAMPLINAALEGETGTYVAAELPTAEIPQGTTVIYQDDFSDSSTGWPSESDSSEAYYYQNGRYFIEINTANHLRPVKGGENLTNSIIEIDAHVEHSSSDGDFGVVCRYQDDNNFYLFDITEDSYYGIFKMISGEWYNLVDYTYSDILTSIQNATFHVSCIGNKLSFAVNGKLLGEVQDTSISSGDYGFFAGTFTNSGNIVSFDNLVVSQP